MSKINAVRIINLNYNNNSMRVSDETFQMGGQSTLLSLRNGGGKSVLVQMMTAPFVHKQYRKTKDRPFESYFSSSKPTFIMVEWALDQGAGYCLVGMMVRRSQVSEEQSSEPLEIISFISEYTARSEHDIYNIPVVEKSKNEIILKNFNACKQLFELYKKDHSKKFYYYDMNNYAQQRQYFDKLAEYKIYYKEWENIIRKVNLKESGLSELFSDCKNEKELLEKWFLETIENKLNREQNRMKEFQSIIEKYVHMYKDNKSKIERRDTIMCFKEDMEAVLENAENYLQAENSVRSYENRIACIIQELSHVEEQLNIELEELSEKSLLCQEEAAHYLYEKLSEQFHKLNDGLRLVIGRRELIGLEREELEEIITGIERNIHKLECAKQQLAVDECVQDYKLIEQKIDVLRKDEEELEPERQRLGTYLRFQYIYKNDKLNEMKAHNDEEIRSNEALCLVYKHKIEAYKTNIDELKGNIARLTERIASFTSREEEYNNRYKENFSRNIMGDYEAGLLEIRQDEYEKEIIKLTRDHAAHIRDQGEKEEKKKTFERNKEDKGKEKQQLEIELKLLRNEEENYQQQIEERQNIMRYIDVDTSSLWNQDKLLEMVDRKRADIDRRKQQLIQEEHEFQKEWRRLTSGEVLELPQEFTEMLSELDLKPVYGMKWLEKNGNSVEENTRLVRKHPFLPYALILSMAAIEKLEKHGKEIYTSYPIPIIPREALEEVLLEEESSILKFQGISFYMWFNEKLLDTDALQVMVAEKEQEIKKKKEQIEQRNTEYNEFSDMRSKLLRQTITKEYVDENKQKITDTEESIALASQEMADIDKNIKELQHELNMLVATIQEENMQMERCQQRKKDFEQFCLYYHDYQKNRQEAEQCDRDMKRNEDNMKQSENLLGNYTNTLQTLKSTDKDLLNQISEAQGKLLRYKSYDIDDMPNIEITVQEAEARYEAITTRMSSELQELEQRLQKAGNSLQKAEVELKKLEKKYQLTSDKWTDVIYNEDEHNHQEIILEDNRKKMERLNLNWTEEDKKIAVLEKELDIKKKDILEKCKYEEPLPKAEISTVDFDAQINKLNHQLAEIKDQCKTTEKHLEYVHHNQSALSEYEDFVVEYNVELEETLIELDEKRLREFVGTTKRDYNNQKEFLKKRKDKVEADINTLLRKDIYQEDYYRKPLEAILSVTDRAELVLAQINTTLQSYDSQMAKLAVDIAIVEKEKDKIKGLLEDYIKEVHSNMAKIDNNSTITIRERPIKMLRLQIPDWVENEGLYSQRLDDYMEELTQSGIEIYERNENAIDYFSSRITTKNLYDTVVGIGNIQIKLYKIEEQREYPITWADVSRNSGGEGFLSAFVILSSLLHYMRRDDTDIFADRNEGKVLVMDNPFAQTNAVHLLKPLMDMAKKTNTQLICLSGLGGDSIYGRFDNIYVLNLVNASLRGGMQYLRGEHTRGAEEEVMVSSQVEVVEQQMLLF